MNAYSSPASTVAELCARVHPVGEKGLERLGWWALAVSAGEAESSKPQRTVCGARAERLSAQTFQHLNFCLKQAGLEVAVRS